MKYTDSQLKEILLEQDYPAALLDSVVSQLQNLAPEAQEAFDQWVETRKVPEFDINGVTPAFLRKYRNCPDIAIILAYSGLLKNPQHAYLLKRPVIKHTNA